jgi:FlaA1/EpsC-like NDP-sugar epimerase
MGPTYSGKIALVTGAAGCLGSAIAKALLGFTPRRLILLDNSESGLYRLQLELTGVPTGSACAPILGDIQDGGLLAELFERYQPDIVFHAAAFKHLSILETNPFEAVRNNTVGTWSLARAAVRYKTAELLVISTDKAVNPHSVLGVSKRMAELASLRWSSAASPINVIRLGNVLDSPGSVVPLFRSQILAGGPVTVTHPEVRRYFLSLEDAVDLVLRAGSLEGGGQIFVPHPGEPVKILDLARQVIRETAGAADRDIPILFTGLRPGDKLTEEFVSNGESAEPASDARLQRIAAPPIVASQFDASMDELVDSLSSRDLSRLLEILRRWVPEYRPSDLLLGRADHSARRT